MRELDFAIFFLEEWEVDNPNKLEVVAQNVEFGTQLVAKCGNKFCCARCCVGNDKDGVAILYAKSFQNVLLFLLLQEFYCTAGKRVIVVLEPAKTFAFVIDNKLCHCIVPLATFVGTSCLDCLDCFAVEYGKLACCKTFGQIYNLKWVAEIGLVATIVAHCIGVCQTFELGRYSFAGKVLDDFAHQVFHYGKHVLLSGKGHFQVKLVKFAWGAVCTSVLVSKTWSKLEVVIETADHQQLLELLWRLWQSVELAWVKTAWNQKVACAFGAGRCQNWSLNFQKVVVVHVVAYVLHKFGAQHDTFVVGRVA